MRILKAELLKVLTKRFVLLLLAAIVINVFLFQYNLDSNYDGGSADAYAAACRDMAQMSEADRINFVISGNQMIEACMNWEFYYMDEKASAEDIDDKMLQYQQLYESGEYLRYTNSVFMERQLFRTLSQQLQQIQNYQQQVENAVEEAKIKTSVSIFAKPGTFSHRNQLAIIERFAQLKSVEPVFDVSDGVLNMQNSPVTDLIALLMLLFLCTQLMVAEEKNGMLAILRATQKGRLPLILAKVITTAVLSLLVFVVLWGSNLIYCAKTFGLGDLSRPVQSLNGYDTCAMLITVGEYLGLFFLSKWLLYFIVGLLCLTAGLIFRSAMPTWLTVGSVVGIGYALSVAISPISNLNILKFINIGNCIFSASWMDTYRNVDIFGYPLEVLTASWLLIGVLLVGAVCWLLILFCSQKPKVFPKLKRFFRLPKWFPRPGRTTKLFSHENWKLLVECGGIMILLLFFLICWQEPRSLYYSSEAQYYKSYMEILSGPLTQEKLDYLESEEMRFDGIRKQMQRYSQDYADGKITEDMLEDLLDPLQRALSAETILRTKIYPRIDRLTQMQQEGKIGWLVYEPGYEYLFGITAQKEKASAAALLVTAMVLMFSNFYPMETSSGMLPLLTVYRRGRGITAWCKLLLCLGCTVLLYLLAQIPSYWYFIENYGFVNLQAPLCSLEVFANWSDTFSILGGLLFVEGLKLLASLCIAVVILLIGNWRKNQIVTLSLAAGLLVLPLVLHLLGVTLLDPFSFYYPLTGADILATADPLSKGLLYYGCTYLLGAVSVVTLVRYANNGYRYAK